MPVPNTSSQPTMDDAARIASFCLRRSHGPTTLPTTSLLRTIQPNDFVPTLQPTGAKDTQACRYIWRWASGREPRYIKRET